MFGGILFPDFCFPEQRLKPHALRARGTVADIYSNLYLYMEYIYIYGIYGRPQLRWDEWHAQWYFSKYGDSRWDVGALDREFWGNLVSEFVKHVYTHHVGSICHGRRDLRLHHRLRAHFATTSARWRRAHVAA